MRRPGMVLVLAGCLVLPAAAAAQAPVVAAREFVFKTTAEGDLKAYVHYPSDWKETDQRPAIVFFFGGGWTNGKVTQFESQADHLAGLGMVAVRADYRIKSKHGVTPDRCVEDAKSAIRWVRKNARTLGIDPARIVAAGGSAGAHLAACTATCDDAPESAGEDLSISSRANAMVLFNPVLSFSSAPEIAKRHGVEGAMVRRISPTQHLTKDSPPALLLYGTTDALLAQGKEYVEASKQTGNRAELFLAEGVGHGFFNRPPWKEQTLKPMDDFLRSIGYLPAETKPKGG